MKTSELIYMGIKGSVVALNRSTGQQVWAARLKGIGFVNVALEGDQVIATTYGEVFSLDPSTGQRLWHNPLKGFGLGLATIASSSTPANTIVPVMEEKRRRDQQAAGAAAAATTVG